MNCRRSLLAPKSPAQQCCGLLLAKLVTLTQGGNQGNGPRSGDRKVLPAFKQGSLLRILTLVLSASSAARKKTLQGDWRARALRAQALPC